MALSDMIYDSEKPYGRINLLLDALMECGLKSGNNPVIVQDEVGREYKIVDVTNETGDIAIILADPGDPGAW